MKERGNRTYKGKGEREREDNHHSFMVNVVNKSTTHANKCPYLCLGNNSWTCRQSEAG